MTDGVQSDIQAFGIAGEWKATASKAEVWIETVTGGWAEVHGRVEERRGRRGWTWPGEERSNETGKLVSGGRLPKRTVFGYLEGAVRRGRGGKEKE